MTKNHRDPDVESVRLITAQINGLLKKAMVEKTALTNDELVYTVCHLYENKEFLLQEAGLDAPVAAKHELEIQTICDKIDKIRSFAWNGDSDPQQGIKLAKAAAPFIREYGIKIKKMIKGET